MSINKKLILILPVFNAVSILPKTLAKLDDFFCEKNYLNMIIFVDDGSTDSTYESILSYKNKTNFNIQIIQNKKNIGKGGSIKKAVNMVHDSSDIIIFTDIDLPYGLESIEGMVLKFENNPTTNLIIGSRDLICDKKHKQYNNYRLFCKKIFSLLLPHKVRKFSDTQSGIKGFDKSITAKFNLIKTNRWCFDIELLLIAINNNLNVVELPVKLMKLPSNGGVSLLRHGINIIKDLQIIKKRDCNNLYKYD